MEAKYSYLLILACSQRKRPDEGLLPAIERYDGPCFRLLRRFFQQQHSPSPEISIYILSAQFGLIPSERLIPDYDRRMTRPRASELQPEAIAELKQILASKPYQKFLLCMGQDYFPALGGYDMMIPNGLTVQVATGSLNKKLSLLYQWLYGKPPEQPRRQSAGSHQGSASVKGVEVILTPAQVVDLARQALETGKGNPHSYQSWYVLVDGQKIAPKWLVSQLTGLPVSSFHSMEARRVLLQLGIEVYAE